MNYRRALLPVLIGLLLFVGVSASMAFAPDSGLNDGVQVESLGTYVLTADRTGPTKIWLGSSALGFTKADIFWSVDGATVTDTLDLSLQVSPNGALWATHASSPLGSQITTTVTGGYETVDVVGRFYRVTYDVATTSPVTVSMYAVLR